MKKLLQGIVEFRKSRRPGYRETFAKLALGQSPDALLIACSDSRVVPNVFASTEPGDLFVVRNVGNLVPPCGPDGRSPHDRSEPAAIEFAARLLKVSDIIVCGHSDCGAMRALGEPPPEGTVPHLADWLAHARGAFQDFTRGRRLNAEQPEAHHLSQLNTLRQVDHLRTYPAVKDRLTRGALRLHAWWFDIAQAEVLAYEPSLDRFVVIDETHAERLLKQLS